MTSAEKELEARLSSLPDLYPGFVRSSMFLLRTCGLIDEALQMLKETPNATTGMVTDFRLAYCGDMELCDEGGKRIPVNVERLTLTFGMRDIIARMKGKTFKSHEFIPTRALETGIADRSVRLNLGQHAVDLNSRCFSYNLNGKTVELAQLLCEDMDHYDDFAIWSDLPAHAYAVGERITGVELVTDRVKAEVGGETCGFDIDVAVAVRTAHAVYTFSRESWRSTEIRISVADDIAIPYEVGECDAGWLGASPEDEIVIAKVTRKTAKLA